MSDGAPRARSPQARLARMGFRQAETSWPRLRDLARGDEVPEEVLTSFAAAPDPDLAVASFAAIVEATGREDLLEVVASDDQLRTRLTTVLGTSEALGGFLARHGELVAELADPALDGDPATAADIRAGLLTAVGADPAAPAPTSELEPDAAMDALRVDYHRRLLRLAARDLTQRWPIDRVGTALADLAAGTLEAALAIARRAVGDPASCCRLAVIGLGKTGGRELNYVSDVDVVFVYEPADDAADDAALRAATQLAARLMRTCSTPTAEGVIWQVDAGLRPEGRSGPLARTLASHLAYYDKWAKTWEFQALLKARPLAGDPELGQAYADASISRRSCSTHPAAGWCSGASSYAEPMIAPASSTTAALVPVVPRSQPTNTAEVSAYAAGFDHRIDFVFGRTADGDPLRVSRGQVTGDEVCDRDPATGLWPSDHAGVVLRLRGL